MSDGHSTDQPLLRIELRDPVEPEIRLLRSLQLVLLKHPVACQSAFNALLAEGRRFGETPEGRLWRERLQNSSLLQRARLVFDLSTLGLLEENEIPTFPSAYLDALFLAASSGNIDELMNKMFWRRESDDQIKPME